MNLLHLYYFYVVAKEHGFTRASKILSVQQPAISRMVRQLEEELGFRLFEKVGRNVQLTTQGRQVFEKSCRIFKEVEDLKASLGKIGGECGGPMALAAAEPIASHYVPGVLQKMLPVYEGLYPMVYSGPASMLLQRIISGELEFGLFFHIPQLPSKLELKVVKKIRFHLVVRKDLRRNRSILESFIGSREIDDSETRSFPTLEKLRTRYPDASIKISSNNLTAHKELVLKGLGVAVLPEFLIKEELKSGRLVDLLPNENLEFALKQVNRRSAVLSLNAQTFLENCVN